MTSGRYACLHCYCVVLATLLDPPPVRPPNSSAVYPAPHPGALANPMARSLRFRLIKGDKFAIHVLPMQLELGDKSLDEPGEWRVIGRPLAMSGSTMVSTRVENVRQLGVTQIRSWGAHERVMVRRPQAR